MTASASAILPNRGGISGTLSDVFWRRPKLLLFLMLAPPVLWLGIVYLGSLFALLLQSFYSIDEFSGMVVREAAAMGTPALLIEGSCSAEGITHGENGYLCQNSVEAITDAILAALPTAHEVGERAKETIPIPWDTLMTQVVARYEALIARKNKGRL